MASSSPNSGTPPHVWRDIDATQLFIAAALFNLCGDSNMQMLRALYFSRILRHYHKSLIWLASLDTRQGQSQKWLPFDRLIRPFCGPAPSVLVLNFGPSLSVWLAGLWALWRVLTLLDFVID